MTGLPQFNYPAFVEAAKQLRRKGYDVVSPAELDDPDDKAAALASKDGSMLHYSHGTGKTWGDFLARDVKLLADDGVDAIVVLDNWERSKGARLETFVGHLLGMRVMRFEWFYGGDFTIMEVPLSVLASAWADKEMLTIDDHYAQLDEYAAGEDW
jgi:hypothetical protein